MAGPAGPCARPVVSGVTVRGFRSIDRLALELPPVCALVGEARAGKSNLLAAVRAALDPTVALEEADLAAGASTLEVVVRLATGGTATIRGAPPDVERSIVGEAPPVVFLPADLRSGGLLAMPATASPAGSGVRDVFKTALGDLVDRSQSSTARSIAEALHTCRACGVVGTIILIEEPELYLRPQAQRYLYRLLRRFAADGNQVLYSTHSPAFLNVARLDELVFLERPGGGGTRAVEPEVPEADADFRILSEFDAERAELLLARAAILVEGQTEKLALPFVFEALGEDMDLEGITIVECGGKWNIPLFARVCRAAGVPFVAVFDRDAPPGRRPSAANRAVAASITALAGEGQTFELAPDFEGVAGIRPGKHGKPERAWRRFADLAASDLSPELVLVANRALEIAVSLPAIAAAERPTPAGLA